MLEWIQGVGNAAWQRLAANVTLVLAIWGALTGTLALFLRWREASRDQAVLRVVPEVATATATVPPRLRLSVTLTNTGRRTVKLDRYILERPWLRLFGIDIPPWREVWGLASEGKTLNEADRDKVFDLEVPQEALLLARRIRVVDTLDNSWLGKPKVKGLEASRHGTVAPLDELYLGNTGEPRSVVVGIYPPTQDRSDYYRLQMCYWDRKSQKAYSVITVRGESKARDAYAQWTDAAQRYNRSGKLDPQSLWGVQGRSSGAKGYWK